MEFNENRTGRLVFNWQGLFQYFKRKSLNKKTVRQLRELTPEQLKDLGISRHDLSQWD